MSCGISRPAVNEYLRRAEAALSARQNQEQRRCLTLSAGIPESLFRSARSVGILPVRGVNSQGPDRSMRIR